MMLLPIISNYYKSYSVILFENSTFRTMFLQFVHKYYKT